MIKDYIPISKPLISDEEIQSVSEVLKSGMLAQGKQVAAFEADFGDFLGLPANQLVAVNSGTAALIIALDSLGLNPGDEVITSPFTFIASANSILALGGIPKFVDVRKDTYNINEKLIEDAITDKTKGIIPVHLYGLPCEMDLIREIAEKYSLFVLEDAAQAHGSKYKNQFTGSLGDAGIFSFYPTKNMTTGEGGIIACKDEKTADRCRSIRDHGQKIVDGKVIRYHHDLIGYNWRMTDISAAIGRVQLTKLNQFNQQRKTNAEILTRGLEEIIGLSSPYIPAHCESVYHLYGTQFDETALGISRKDFIDTLRSANVGVRGPYPIPVYQQEVYQRLNNSVFNRWANFIHYPDYLGMQCANTEYLTKRIVEIPNHQGLNNKDMMDILEAINAAITR